MALFGTVEGLNAHFPDPNINPTKRDSAWYKQYCEAALYAAQSWNQGITWSWRGQVSYLRSYGSGTQDPMVYLQHLFPSINEDGTPNPEGSKKAYQEMYRRGMANIDWDDMMVVAPKFKEVLLGMFDRVKYNVDAQSHNEMASEDKERLKWGLWSEAKNAEWLQQMSIVMGQPMIADKWLPSTKAELNMFEQVGGFKLSYEKDCESLAKVGFDISRWDESIKQHLQNDLIDLNACCTHDYFDPVDMVVKTRYVDPEYFISDWSKENGFDDSPYQGHFYRISLAELKRRTGMNDEQVMERIGSLAQNKTLWTGDTTDLHRRDKTGNFYEWERFSVWVMHLEFKCSDQQYKRERKKKDGSVSYALTTYGSKRSDTTVVNKQRLYQCDWVIGTDICMDFGPAYYARRVRGRVYTGYHAYLGLTKSITHRCIPFYNDIALNWYNAQNAKAMAPPSGFAYDITQMKNMVMGGRTINEYQAIAMHSRSGKMVYAGRQMGNPNMQGMGNQSGVPATRLEGGLGGQLNEFQTIHAMNMEYIREASGITLPASASGGSLNDGLGLNQIQVSSTSDALRTLFTGYGNVKERCADSMVARTQLAIRQNSKVYDGYYPVVGTTTVESVKLRENVEHAEVGIRLQAVVDQEQRQELLATARESMKAGKAGMPGISYADYAFLQRLLDGGGSMTFAQTYLAKREAESEQKRAQAAQQSQITDKQLSGQLEQSKQQHEIIKIRVKGEEDRKTEQQAHQNEMQRLGMNNAHQVGLQNMQQSLPQTAG